MQLSLTILNRIKTDNMFSLRMAQKITTALGEPVKQLTLERQAERASDKLLHPAYIEFYKGEGYSEEEIFDKAPQPAK